jgi:hypothetical protein
MRCGLNSSGSRQGPVLAFVNTNNELLGFINGGDFLDSLSSQRDFYCVELMLCSLSAYVCCTTVMRNWVISLLIATYNICIVYC